MGSGEGLPDAHIYSVAEDSLGTLWGSTDAAGVFRIEDSGLESLRDAVNGGAPMQPEIARQVVELFRRFRPPGKADC